MDKPSFSAGALPLTLCELPRYRLLRISGSGARQFLQNQLTGDIRLLSRERAVHAAHCTAEGKVVGRVFVLADENDFLLVCDGAVLAQHEKIFQKYALFSKVSCVSESRYVLVGAAGQGVEAALAPVLSAMPHGSLSTRWDALGGCLRLSVPMTRYLLLIGWNRWEGAFARWFNQAPWLLASQAQWDTLDIQSGWPLILAETCAKYRPSVLNLASIGTIAWDKGCYLGQEFIAKDHYCRQAHSALYALQGAGTALPCLTAGFEWQSDDQWLLTPGRLLSAVLMVKGEVLVQACLPLLHQQCGERKVYRLRLAGELLLESVPRSDGWVTGEGSFPLSDRV